MKGNVMFRMGMTAAVMAAWAVPAFAGGFDCRPVALIGWAVGVFALATSYGVFILADRQRPPLDGLGRLLGTMIFLVALYVLFMTAWQNWANGPVRSHGCEAPIVSTH